MREKIREAVVAFFRASRREMPWRGESEPYRIWLSEVMLQQTRVETVRGRYPAFLKQFPTIHALAAADEVVVCEAWAGLGYYSRARNLHRAANMIVEEYRGRIPSDEAALRKLPGIGRYTAGAVASIAFGRESPAVDGNAARVLARLFRVAGVGAAELQRIAEELVRGEDPGAFNQGLMDIGATICLPRNPLCSVCPLARWCRARQTESVANFPEQRVRAAKRPHEVAFLWAESRNGVWIERRPLAGRWAGLWQLPGVEGTNGRERLARRFAIEVGRKLAEVRHELTHLRVTARVFEAVDWPPLRTSPILRRTKAPLDAPLSALSRKAIEAARKSLIVCATLMLTGCLYDEMPSARNDRRVVVRAPDVGRFLADAPDALAKGEPAPQVRFRKTRSAAGVYTLAYYYASTDGQISIQSTATVTDPESTGSAREIFNAALRNHFAAEDRQAGLRLVPLPLELGRADEARLFLILEHGRPIGNAFAAWRDNVATDLRLSGIYFDDANSFRRLVTPKLARLSRFSPETSRLAERPAVLHGGESNQAN